MRKIILMMLLVVVSSSAEAGWVEVGGTDDGVTIYADPATIRKAGNRVKMWIMSDFQTEQAVPSGGKPYMSQKGQNEYDCKEEQTRLIAFLWYSGNMGGGDMVYSDFDPLKWRPVVPGSVGEAQWKYACGRR
jgi:hypothetical protein